MRLSISFRYRIFTASLLVMLLSFTGPLWSKDKDTADIDFSKPRPVEIPSWFKESFLDLRDDVSEARAQGKLVMLMVTQEGCPYCYALIERTLGNPDVKKFVQSKFDVIAINMYGARELTDTKGKKHYENTYVRAMNIEATPTLVFFDAQGNEISRMVGYRNAEQFMKVLNSVLAKPRK